MTYADVCTNNYMYSAILIMAHNWLNLKVDLMENYYGPAQLVFCE